MFFFLSLLQVFSAQETRQPRATMASWIRFRLSGGSKKTSRPSKETQNEWPFLALAPAHRASACSPSRITQKVRVPAPRAFIIALAHKKAFTSLSSPAINVRTRHRDSVRRRSRVNTIGIEHRKVGPVSRTFKWWQHLLFLSLKWSQNELKCLTWIGDNAVCGGNVNLMSSSCGTLKDGGLSHLLNLTTGIRELTWEGIFHCRPPKRQPFNSRDDA